MLPRRTLRPRLLLLFPWPARRRKNVIFIETKGVPMRKIVFVKLVGAGWFGRILPQLARRHQRQRDIA